VHLDWLDPDAGTSFQAGPEEANMLVYERVS